MKYIILLTCCLLCCIFPLKGEVNRWSLQKDSINNIISRMRGDTARLEYLSKMAEQYQSPPLDIVFARQLYDQSRKSGNEKYIHLGTYYLAGCYDRRHIPDTLDTLVEQLKQLAKQTGYYHYYLEQKGALSRAYASKRQVEKAIYIAKEGLKESMEKNSNNGILAASNALSCAYVVSNRTSTGLEYLLDAYQKFSDSSKLFLKVDILSRIVSAYQQLMKNDKMILYLQEMEALLEPELSNPTTRNNWINLAIDCEIKYVLYAFRMKDLPKAKMHIDRANALYLPESTDPVFWLNIQLVTLQYYGKIKEDSSAIALIDKVTPTVIKNYTSTFPKLITYKASIEKRHNIDQAIKTIKYLINTQDSLNVAFSISQLNQIKDIYHIDELLLEKKKISNSNYIKGIFILLILTLLILGYWIYIRFLSRKMAITEKEISAAAEQIEAESRAKEMLRRGISYDIRNPLNAVIGFADLLAKSDDTLDRQSRITYCQIIQKSASELLEYVSNILELSRLESAKIQYEDVRCDIVAICKEVVFIADNTENNLVKARLDTRFSDFNLPIDAGKLRDLLKSMVIAFESGGICKKYNTVIHLEYDAKKKDLSFFITDTPMANNQNDSKTMLIRNGINAHFVRHYNGVYKVIPMHGSKPGNIVFTIPVNVIK